jgi:hypothetical protein
MDSQLFGHSWLETALESEEDQDSSTYSFQDAIVKSDEVFKNPVHLFGQFVLAVPSDDWEDIEQLEVSRRLLCIWLRKLIINTSFQLLYGICAREHRL